MKIRELAQHWEENAKGRLTKTGYVIHLDVEAAARLAAIAEMYPKRQTEELLGELIGAALEELEASFPTSRASTSLLPMRRAIHCTRTSALHRASWPCPGVICRICRRNPTNKSTDPTAPFLTLHSVIPDPSPGREYPCAPQKFPA